MHVLLGKTRELCLPMPANLTMILLYFYTAQQEVSELSPQHNHGQRRAQGFRRQCFPVVLLPFLGQAQAARLNVCV